MLTAMLTALLACPGYTGHVTIHTYEGPVELVYCVSSFVVSPPDIYMDMYDSETDGLFHNGFETAS